MEQETIKVEQDFTLTGQQLADIRNGKGIKINGKARRCIECNHKLSGYTKTDRCNACRGKAEREYMDGVEIT